MGQWAASDKSGLGPAPARRPGRDSLPALLLAIHLCKMGGQCKLPLWWPGRLTEPQDAHTGWMLPLTCRTGPWMPHCASRPQSQRQQALVLLNTTGRSGKGEPRFPSSGGGSGQETQTRGRVWKTPRALRESSRCRAGQGLGRRPDKADAWSPGGQGARAHLLPGHPDSQCLCEGLISISKWGTSIIRAGPGVRVWLPPVPPSPASSPHCPGATWSQDILVPCSLTLRTLHSPPACPASLLCAL